MKNKFLFIIIFIVVNLNAFSREIDPVLENILIVKKEKFSRINLFFNKQVEFTSQKKGEFIEISLNNLQISETFPGSEFGVNSQYLNSIIISREIGNRIFVRIKTNILNDYNIYFLKDTKDLIIDIFNPAELSIKDNDFRIALKYQADGQYEKALKEYRKLVSENYNNSELFFHAGLIRELLGFVYQAKSNYSTSKSMGESYPDIYARLSEIFTKLNQKENAAVENKKFIIENEKLKKKKNDTSLVKILKDIRTLITDDSFNLAQNSKSDSQKSADLQNALAAGKKSSETKIIKMEPIDKSPYYYTLIANIVVVLVAIACVISVWLLVRNKKSKNKVEKKDKKSEQKNLNLLSSKSILEKPEFDGFNLLNNQPPLKPLGKKIIFDDFVNEYRKYDVKENVPQIKKEPEVQEEVKIVNERVEGDEIEKLSKKYKIEREKIELALKLISKNVPESSNDKYLMLEKMLKDKTSIEELAIKLRIPKGEIDLISSLNNM